jgi:hypothetical protein
MVKQPTRPTAASESSGPPERSNFRIPNRTLGGDAVLHRGRRKDGHTDLRGARIPTRLQTEKNIARPRITAARLHTSGRGRSGMARA